jgi:hypothetical protein
MLWPSNSAWFDPLEKGTFIEIFTAQLLPDSSHIIPLSSRYYTSTLFSKHSQSLSLPLSERTGATIKWNNRLIARKLTLFWWQKIGWQNILKCTLASISPTLSVHSHTRVYENRQMNNRMRAVYSCQWVWTAIIHIKHSYSPTSVCRDTEAVFGLS